MNKMKRCQNCSEEIEDDEGKLLCEDCSEEAEIADEALNGDDEQE